MGIVIDRALLLGTVLIFLATPLTAQEHNRLTAAERAAGWQLLFDGNSLEGWRGYNSEFMPTGWSVENGLLTRTGPGGDIITEQQFGDFELYLEWLVGPGGNSGVLVRAVEGQEEVYHGAPEMQILDDAGHPDGRSPLTSAGSNYGLHGAPRGIVKSAGEWNSSRIVVVNNQVEHWLNGDKVVEYELGSADWLRRVANSKFAQWPEYGRASRGHIGIQDHGDRVSFRNLKVREIK
ncbi:MAG: DUF1080 domain-containing protein [Gemmatimonadetes bacterium]|nr:DUF1080 domain-containing protein [Gemmatimonadota bacterium]